MSPHRPIVPAFVLLASLAVACASEQAAPADGSPPAVVSPRSPEPAVPAADAAIEEFDVTFTPGKGLQFQPVGRSSPPSVGPQGFRDDRPLESSVGHFTFESAPDTDRAGPNGVFGDCGARQVCAQVGIGVTTDFAGDTVPDVWVRVVNLDLGVTVANGDVPPGGAGSVLLPALNGIDGRPLAAFYTYGVLPDGGAPLLAAKRWNFNLPAGFDETTQIFKFRVGVVASFHHSAAVGYSVNNIPGQTLDACASGTQLLDVQDDDQVSNTIALPWVAHVFKFSSYAPDTGVNSRLWASDNGTFGIGLPSSSAANGRLALFPFGLNRGAIAPYWQDLVFADLAPADPSGLIGQVCAQVAGSHPDRTMTVTWKNMELVDAGARTGKIITFSGVLFESSDVIQFHYNAPSVIDADTRGGLATVGIQGSDPPGPMGAGAARQSSNKTPFLPNAVGSYPFGLSIFAP